MAESPQGETGTITELAARPLLSSPPMTALAMLPPPMNAIVSMDGVYEAPAGGSMTASGTGG